MASWTDNPQINFNPYVQQLPVEAMMAVGMEKQRRYDEGVQRIQANIDRIAGLDIARDVDKDYLRSKMNELGTKLRVVAAGDFSNYQLVNSVTGMAAKVAKDENILSAVAATAKMKEEDAAMKEAVKNGKSSANREYDYLRGRTEWLNDTTVGKSYDVRYKQHIDVNKKVLDVIQKLNPNVNIYDIPYIIRSDGSIDYDKINSVMVRRGEKGLSEGQIRTAITAMLEADDYDELASQGRFNYRNASGDALQKQLTRNYLSTKERYRNVLEEMNKKLLMTSDPGDQATLNEAISQYRMLLGDGSTRGALDDEYATLSEQVLENPDAVRASLYTKNWVDQMANGFAYSEKDTKIMDNPYQTYRFKLEELELEKLKAAGKAGEGKEGAAAGDVYWKRSGDETTRRNEALNNWKDYNNSLAAENDNILKRRADRYSSASTTVTPEDVLENIKKYMNGNYNPNEDEQADFDRFIRNDNAIANQKALYEEYKAQAQKELSKEFGLDKKLAVVPDLQLSTPNGTISFTSKEVFDYLLKEEIESVMMQSSAGAYAVTKKSMNDEKLTPKEKILKSVVARRYYSNSGNSGVASADRYFNELGKIVSEGKAYGSKVEGRIAEKMAPVTGEFATESTNIPITAPKDRELIKSELSHITTSDEYITGWDERGGRAKYKPSKVLDKILDEKTQFYFTRKGNKYFVDVADAGGITYSIPVEEDYVRKSTLMGEKLLNKDLDFSTQLLHNKGTTNIFKDYEHAYYRKGSFGFIDSGGANSVTLPIVADLEQEPSGNLYPVIRLKLKNGTIAIPKFKKPATSRAEFETYLKTLTNELIYQLFEKNGFENIRKQV